MKPLILYVEDDEDLAFITKDQLELAGYRIDLYSNGMDALGALQKSKYDLCLLDIMLPQLDGFSLAKKIREISQHIPILFLTAKSLEEDKITGFKIGADDYITKPYSINELTYKIKVFLKRGKVQKEGPKNEYSLGEYRFYVSELTLVRNNQKSRLTTREAEVLLLLLQNANRTVRREDILTQIWGENDYFSGRSLDVFISRLRKHLKKDPNICIENIHSVGFKLSIKNKS